MDRLGFETFVLIGACIGALVSVLISLVGAARAKWRDHRIAYLEGKVATLRQQNVRLRNELSQRMRLRSVNGRVA